jgi:2-iminobutanoate/2-iminopropanoate deaminase
MTAISPGYGDQHGDVNRTITPPSIAPPAAAYAHAVLSEAPAWILHTAGVVPVASDGTVPDTVSDQAAVVWTNVGAILAEAGMDAADVVSVTTYAVVGAELGAVMAARDRFMAGHLAASTLVMVPALARPEWRVEVAVVAVR